MTVRDVIEYVRHMLFAIALLLMVLWFLGLTASYTLGGFIHLLLMVAITLVLVQLFRGKDAR